MMTQESRIEAKQAELEAVIRDRLHSMQSARIDNGRVIDGQSVVEQMHTMDPDRFCLAVYLTNQANDEAQILQGRQIMTQLRAVAIDALIRHYGAHIHSEARRAAKVSPEVPHAVA